MIDLVQKTFRCGHPRTPENSWGWGKRSRTRCKTCRQAYKRGEQGRPTQFKGDGVTTWKACGCPKTAENTWSMGRYDRCKACHKVRLERYRQHGPTQPRQRRRKTSTPDLSLDPAVQLYRQERERVKAKTPPVHPVVSLDEHRTERRIPRFWGAA